MSKTGTCIISVQCLPCTARIFPLVKTCCLWIILMEITCCSLFDVHFSVFVQPWPAYVTFGYCFYSDMPWWSACNSARTCCLLFRNNYVLWIHVKCNSSPHWALARLPHGLQLSCDHNESWPGTVLDPACSTFNSVGSCCVPWALCFAVTGGL